MKTKVFILFIVTSLILLTTIVSCRKDDPEPEPPVLKPPFLQVWASPESVPLRGSSTIEWKIENVRKVQIGTLIIESPFGGSVTYANLLKDTSIFCSATGYNNQVIRDTVYIKVVQPPVVVPKTAKDTLMSMYWMLVEEIFRSSNGVDTVNISEARRTRRLYFRSNDIAETFSKDGVLTGSATYSIKGDSLRIGGYWYKYLLTKSTFTRIYVYEKDTTVSKFLGFMD